MELRSSRPPAVGAGSGGRPSKSDGRQLGCPGSLGSGADRQVLYTFPAIFRGSPESPRSARLPEFPGFPRRRHLRPEAGCHRGDSWRRGVGSRRMTARAPRFPGVRNRPPGFPGPPLRFPGGFRTPRDFQTSANAQNLPDVRIRTLKRVGSLRISSAGGVRFGGSRLAA